MFCNFEGIWGLQLFEGEDDFFEEVHVKHASFTKYLC